ncbi:hypothetical protein HID58_005628 [Brassica napus]|uniref:Reverse transcriptase zinc-binding domain-containing protein n=1 Tax=Brassica napus TaxID=3708 RepID=A0ABQ8E9T7_BRANA|nr:hypothetical protein HID58_005628 [Brassica napus]
MAPQSIWSSWFRVEILDGDIEKFWVINTRQKHSWLVNKLLDAREIIYPWIRQRVQNGETTYFWSTNWSPYGKLTDYLHTPGAMRFPVNKNATIAELWKNGAWVLPNARSDRQVERPTTNKTNKTLLLLCWQATLYTLWTERNNRLHNAQFSSPEILVSQIKLIIKNRAFSLRIDRPKLASSLLQLWFST